MADGRATSTGRWPAATSNPLRRRGAAAGRDYWEIEPDER